MIVLCRPWLLRVAASRPCALWYVEGGVSFVVVLLERECVGRSKSRSAIGYDSRLMSVVVGRDHGAALRIIKSITSVFI